MIENLIKITLVFLGALFLLIGALNTRKIIKVSPPLLFRWTILKYLIYSFILGYFLFSLAIWFDIDLRAVYISSLIMFGGGIFVFIITGLSLQTIDLIKKASQFKIESEQDGLTNLYNLRFFKKQMKILIKKVKKTNKTMVLIFMDLDNFKSVNDIYGHAAGDKLLQKTAYILTSSLRKHDFVVRMGGDEFVIVLHKLESKFVNGIINRIKERLKVYVKKNLPKVKNFGCSVGIAELDASCDGIDCLLAKADKECYAEKNKKHKRY